MLFPLPKTKRKTVLIIAMALGAIISISAFFLLQYLQSSNLESAVSELKDYFSNDFKADAFLSEAKLSSYNWHQYILVKALIHDRVSAPYPDNEYMGDVEFAEALFAKECPDSAPEACKPYEVLSPYCMSKRGYFMRKYGSMNGLGAELRGNVAYANAIKYWEKQIGSKELEESDLPAVLGFVTCRLLAGDFNAPYTNHLAKKVMDIEIDELGPADKGLDSMKKKANILRALMAARPAADWQNREIRHAACELFEAAKSKEKSSVCMAHNFYLLTVFCGREPMISSGEDYALLAKFLKARYSSLDDVLCQIGLLTYTEQSLKGLAPVERTLK